MLTLPPCPCPCLLLRPSSLSSHKVRLLYNEQVRAGCVHCTHPYGVQCVLLLPATAFCAGAMSVLLPSVPVP